MTPQPGLEPPASTSAATTPAAASWLAPRAETQGFPRYVEVIRAGRWIILASLLACIGGAILYLSQAENVYEAQSDLLVNPLPDLPVPIPGVIQQSSDPTRDVETAAKLVASPTVARRVRTRLKLDTTTTRLLKKVDVNPVAQSNVVTITAKGASPGEAVELANAFGEEFVTDRTDRLHDTLDDYIKRLTPEVQGTQPGTVADPESPAAQLQFLRTLREGPDPSVRLESKAERPTEPVSPRPVLTMVAGVLGGGVLGLLGAFGLQLLDPRLRREEQLRSMFRLPILARVPLEKRRKNRPLLPSELSLGALDAYQALRAALSTGRRDAITGHALLVTGPSPGDGKTTAAINLASTIAAAGKRVILIEADSRRPSIGRALEMRADIGLASVITGRHFLVDALLPVGGEDSKLKVLLTSPDEAPAADVLSHLSVDTLLLQAQRLADWVIVDSPPLNHVAETLALARAVEDVLVVARIGHSNTRDLTELAEMLAQQGITPAGFVLLGGHARSGYY
jgi:Mrp family chromosome partitioning ATPase